MKIVLNECWSGFELSEEFIKTYPQFEEINCSTDEKDRANQDFIKAIEEFGVDKASGECADFYIVEIPENATDWEIIENCGDEHIIYVVDGKINHIF